MRPKRKDLIEQAIAKTAKMLARDGIKVTQRGATAFCEWDSRTGKVKSINLPVLPENPTEEFLSALQGYMDHEVAHALLTDALGQDKLAQKSRLLSKGVSLSMLRKMVNVVEDIRIEAKILAIFPGSVANLNKVRAYLIDTCWRPQALKLTTCSEREKSAIKTNLLIPYLRGLAGQKVCSDFSDEVGSHPYFRALHTRIPNFVSRLQNLETPQDVLSMAEDLIEANEMVKPPPPSPQRDKNEPERSEPSDDQETADDSERENSPSEGNSQPAPGDDSGDDSGDAAADHDDDDDGDDSDDSDDSDDGKSAGQKSTFEAALKRLHPSERQAIYMYSKKNKSIEDIANKMHKTTEEVTALLKNARTSLNNDIKSGS